MIKKRFLSILALLCLTVSGAWAGAEPPLITIESKDYTSFKSGSQTFDNKVTVTFSGNVSYDSEYGWFSAQERTLTVTAAEGYTITGVRFSNGSGFRFVSEAPFEAILGYDNDNGVYFAKVNGTSIGTGDAGVTKIEVFGNAVTPAVVNPVQIDGLYYNLDADNMTAEVTSMPSGKYTGDIIIPESVEYYSVTYTVTSIGSGAFYECSGLTSITIPNSVTTDI